MIFVYFPQKTSCQHFTEEEKLDLFSFPACEFVQTWGRWHIVNLLFKISNDYTHTQMSIHTYTARLLLLMKDVEKKKKKKE